ncbi:MAG: winged helix-turn-helix domain-containing protein, partial [Verrucomicrobiaceae bacterium]|nr:winged helix-turn-helix domain-containing protein [Verrucomicrobiaceae bacterium]
MRPRHDEVTAALRDRLLSGIHLGLVKEGSRLPSVRDVAKEFGATPRTVMAAYRQLERENLVRLRPRSGIYVVAPHASESIMLSQIGAWAVDVLVQGLMRNIPPISLPKHLGRCLETVTVRTACIGDNADQIYSLCSELSADYGLHTSGVDLQTVPAGRKAEDYFSKVDLLVSTPLHTAAVASLGRRVRKPWLIVSLRQEVVRQVASLIESEDLYF